MRELTTFDDLCKLVPGDRVYKVDGAKCRGFDIVGRMPGCRNYIILSDGEHLEHIHSSKVDKFSWFIGKYDSNIIGQRMIENLYKEIDLVREIYIDEPTKGI
jgi:hypothetical protein